jgi:hypothetical protein
MTTSTSTATPVSASADAIRANMGVNVLVIKPVERTARPKKSDTSVNTSDTSKSVTNADRKRREMIDTIGRVMAFKGKPLRFPNAHTEVHHADRVRNSLKACELFLENPARYLDNEGRLAELSAFENIVREIQAAWLAIPAAQIKAEAIRRIDYGSLLTSAGIFATPAGIDFDAIPSQGKVPTEWYSTSTAVVDDSVLVMEVSELTVANSWLEFAEDQLKRITNVGDRFFDNLVPNVTPEAAEDALEMLRRMRSKWNRLLISMKQASYRLGQDYVGKNKKNNAQPNRAHRLNNRY